MNRELRWSLPWWWCLPPRAGVPLWHLKTSVLPSNDLPTLRIGSFVEVSHDDDVSLPGQVFLYGILRLHYYLEPFAYLVNRELRWSLPWWWCLPPRAGVPLWHLKTSVLPSNDLLTLWVGSFVEVSHDDDVSLPGQVFLYGILRLHYYLEPFAYLVNRELRWSLPWWWCLPPRAGVPLWHLRVLAHS